MACSYMWVYTVYLALCIHLMNAMRAEFVDSNNRLFCECKTVESESECNRERKFYHPEVNKCCRMAKKKNAFHKFAVWKSTYVRQGDKEQHLCLKERLPFKDGACCTVANSTKFFGESMRILLSHATVYSLANPNITTEPKEEDYRKKSKIVIEMDDISSGTLATTYLGYKLPADKIIEGLNQIRQKDQLLQCEEYVTEVVPRMTCRVREQPMCCCTQETLDRNVNQKLGADSPVCIKKSCAPNRNHLWLKGKLKVKSYLTLHGQQIPEAVEWDKFEPFHKCPANFSWKGLTFVKEDLSKQLTGHKYGNCTKAQRLKTSPVETRTWCIEKYYSKVCPAGQVRYSGFRGHILKDAVLCPSGYKSNLPGDLNFDSKCDCKDEEQVMDSLGYSNHWRHGTGEVMGPDEENPLMWKPKEWMRN